jgi:hypothetical protein
MVYYSRKIKNTGERKKMKLSANLLMAAIFLGALCYGKKAESAETKPQELKAAIFVVNNAGKGFDNSLDTLNDLLTNRLTEKGLTIIDKKYVAKPMTETKEDSDQVKSVKRQLSDFNVSMQKRQEDFLATIKDDMDGASALRIAQQIGADYVLVATITSFGKQTKKVKLSSQNIDVTESTLRIGIKLLEGVAGGSVYGDIVKTSKTTDNTIVSDDTEQINSLLDDAAVNIANNVGKRIKDKGFVAPPPVVDSILQINCNVENANVMMDGTVVGNCGQKLKVKPGLHAVAIQREWFRDWKRSVNVQPGMVLNVQLELSELGMKKYKEIKTFELTSKRYEVLTDADKAAIADRTKLNAAEAYMIMKIGDAALEKAKHPADTEININADLNVNKGNKDYKDRRDYKELNDYKEIK